MHVHLDHERCLEVIVMRGRADKLQKAAEKLFATQGVIQGSIEIVAETSGAPGEIAREDEHAKAHAHGHAHTHARPKRARSRAKG
jgi:CopG family nickel-responsive transcriptional regulator